MSTVSANTILDATGGNTATINGATPTVYNTMGKNRVINGSMVVAQRGGGASTTLTNSATTYCVDRWAFYRDVGGTFTAVQSGTAPAGFSSSSLITASTGASPSAAQVNFVQQQIEGFNVDDLKWGTSDAKSVTLSFWVRSSVTGSFPVGISNVDLTRSNRFDVTISSADTWTYVTKTIAGDTTGTWATGNTAGIRLYFDLGSGSDYVGTADTWTGTWDIRTSSSMTWGANTAATLYITGVQLEVGSVATEFERRPYGTELALCQRYYQHSYATGTAVGTATSVGAAHFGGGQNGSTTGYLAGPWILFPVQLRTFPTITVWDIGGNSGVCHRFTYAVGGANSQSYSIAATSDKSIYGYSSGSTNYAGVSIHWRAEAEL